MLTDRQKFKAVFLEKCAAAGLSLEETEKRAHQALTSILGANGLLRGMDIVGGVGRMATPLLVGGPLVGGLLTGYTAAKMTDPGAAGAVKEMQDDDRIREYKRLVEEAKLNQAAAAYAKERQRAGRLY